MKKRYLILLVGFASLKGLSQTAAPVASPVPATEKEYDISFYGF